MNTHPIEEKTSTTRLGWVTLFTLTGLNILNYIDRNIFSAMMPSIQRDLGFTDTQLGLLGSAFIFSYTLISPVFGFIGDRGPRIKTMAAGLFLWSGATAFSGIARTFQTQFITRVVVGFGEAAYSVISPSVLADHFPKAIRGKTFALYSCAIPVGSALGYVLGGILEPRLGWQHSFFVVGVPGVLLAFVLLFLREPKRGAQDEIPESTSMRNSTANGAGAKSTNGSELSLWKAYLSLFKNGGFLYTVLGYAAYTFVLGGLSFWMPTYIVRYFEGVTAEKGNIVFGGVTVVGGFVGTVIGGILADRIEKRSGNGYLKVAVLSMILSVPSFFYLITIRDFNQFAIVLFFVDVFLFLCISPLDAAVIGAVRPALRATAMALNIFLIHALGDGISRVLMGWVSDSSGLHTAVALLPWVLALAGVLWAVGVIGFWQPMLWPKGALNLPRFQAHRGFRPSGDVVENTLAAFRRAKLAGAEMVECDIQLSSDRQPIVFHDENLKRLGQSDDLTSSLTAEELQKRVQAPLLRDLLADPESPRYVNIEIKSGETFGKSGIESEIVRVVREAGASDRVLFSSFNPLALRRLWKLAPDIPRALLVTEENDPKNKIYLKKMWLGFLAKPHLVHLDQAMIESKKLEQLADRGIKVAAWTVNDPATAKDLLERGVISVISDKVFTDQPVA